ncbi:GNAT family N-acetyltransferase [Nocardioides pantholopis]|uniref:GNAT family N-acetyltransferase n=1 Tax=Nocardioides pantholopis TaxID=2483798 RepID=UPI000F07ABF6|nr:GNAT family N-acetyltransferase [Nocardioides pantholopis]
MSQVDVANAPENSRYEARIGGELAGFADYVLREGRIVFTHTEVDDAFEGQGVGSALAQGALDDVRRSGNRDVVPMCSFIKVWIDKHPDYADLVADPV